MNIGFCFWPESFWFFAQIIGILWDFHCIWWIDLAYVSPMWYILLWFHQDYGRIHQIDCLCRIQAQVQQLHNLASLFCLKESPAISNPRSTLQTPKRPLSILMGHKDPHQGASKVWTSGIFLNFQKSMLEPGPQLGREDTVTLTHYIIGKTPLAAICHSQAK